MAFQLHPQLEKDCHYLGNFPLSALLLSKDANYPWYILVPRQENISEAFQLSDEQQQQLNSESLLLSKTLSKSYSADKMNIAALGNMVPQLHLHHIVRYKTDIAWPNPVWGYTDAQAYNKQTLSERIERTFKALKNCDFTAHAPLN